MNFSLNQMIDGHKEIRVSWIARNWKTFCLPLSQSVNWNFSFSHILPPILVNLLCSLHWVLWNVPRETRVSIESHCRPNFCKCLTSVFKIFYLERIFDGFTFFVKMCPKMATIKYQATYFSTLENRLPYVWRMQLALLLESTQASLSAQSDLEKMWVHFLECVT